TGIRSGSTTTSPAQETSKSNRSIKDWLTRLAMTPDDHSLWVFNALRATLTAIRESKPKLLYSTSPCMSAHLVGLVASHITRLPWIVDLRDPWRGNPFRDLGYRTLDAWDAWLEQRVLRRASHVICNTPTATEALKKRKPWLTARCSTILNGFDSEILTDVVPQRTQPKRTFVFAHAGQFYGRRRPEPWFRALRILLDAHDLGSGEDVRNIRMTLIGNPTCDGISLETIAEREDVRQHVDILGNMNHNAALCHLAGSDAVMLAGATGPGADLQVPNKLFEYLALKRPILAGLAATNPARQILTEASARAECCDPDDPKQIAEAMQRILRQPGTEGQFRNADRFGRRFRALELLSIFHRVATLDPSHARTVAAGTASREDMLEARTTAFDDVSNHAYRR
ncbi:MAG: glycosyltransferase, partial [Phycisphaerae bacterium]